MTLVGTAEPTAAGHDPEHDVRAVRVHDCRLPLRATGRHADSLSGEDHGLAEDLRREDTTDERRVEDGDGWRDGEVLKAPRQKEGDRVADDHDALRAVRRGLS